MTSHFCHILRQGDLGIADFGSEVFNHNGHKVHHEVLHELIHELLGWKSANWGRNQVGNCRFWIEDCRLVGKSRNPKFYGFLSLWGCNAGKLRISLWHGCGLVNIRLLMYGCPGEGCCRHRCLGDGERHKLVGFSSPVVNSRIYDLGWKINRSRGDMRV